MTGRRAPPGFWVALLSSDGSLGPECEIAQELDFVAADTGAVAMTNNRPVESTDAVARKTLGELGSRTAEAEYLCFHRERR